MKINGQLTINFSRSDKQVSIELRDKDASIMFAEILMTAEEYVSALRLACSPVTIDVYGLDKVGKVMEHKNFEFEMPKVHSFKTRKEHAELTVLKLCPEGWKPDLYFGSQGSFFYKDGVEWARTTIRRWVDKGEL